MKVMIVTPFFHPKIGGVEVYAHNVAKDLHKKGNDVFIVTSSCETKKLKIDKLEGITIFSLPVLFTLSNTPINPLWYFTIKRIIKRQKPDVIYAHSPVPFMADCAIFASGKIPTVLTYHSGSMLKGSSLTDIIIKAYERFVLPLVFKNADKIAAVHPQFVKSIIKDSNKIQFTPPGIDTSVFKPVPNTKKIYDLLFVGRIEKTSSWKGLDILINAVSHLKQLYPDISLQVVGQGDAVVDFEQLVRRLGLSKNISFKGAKRTKGLISSYNNSRILVMPSKIDSEAFGMVAAEAMACETPVIASNIGGIPNLVTDNYNGLLVQAGSTESLANAIAKLLKDTKLSNKLGKNGRKTIEKSFSLDILQKNVDKILLSSLDHDTLGKSIIHVISYYPPHLGGMEAVAKNLAEQQTRQGRDVKVITSGSKNEIAQKNTPTVKRLKYIEIASTPIMPMLFFELLKIQQRDTVHVHVAQAFVPEMVWLASKIIRFNYVCQVHLDVAPSGKLGVLLKPYKKYILGRVLRSSCAVTVFSEHQKNTIINQYKLQEEKVIIVPNGVSDNFFINKKRDLRKKPNLLYVGRLGVQKNLDFLLNSLDGISDIITTTIVGDGDEETRLRALCKKLRLQNIDFAGRADGDSLINYYRKADIFVLPSEREGMPLVLLEAMASRLPIIGSDVIGIRELIVDGYNGRLVELNNIDKMRNAIISVINNPSDYTRISNNAYDFVNKYQWKSVAEKFDNEVY